MKPLLTPPAPGQFGSVYPIPAGQASDSLVQSGTSHGSIGGRVRREFDRTDRVEGGKIGRIGPGEVGVKGEMGSSTAASERERTSCRRRWQGGRAERAGAELTGGRLDQAGARMEGGALEIEACN